MVRGQSSQACLKKSGQASFHRNRVNWFAVNLRAGLVDNDDGEPSVGNAGIVPKPPGQIPAVLDRPCTRRKLQSGSVPGRNAILHIEIISAHGLPATAVSREWDTEPKRHPQRP